MELTSAQLFNRGMNQDTSISKVSPELTFAFENRNIRITAINDNTLLSITNEKGPSEVSTGNSTLTGTYLGYCILNKYLVIFTHNDSTDKIYRLNLTTSGSSTIFECTQLVSLDLGFSADHPIETLGYYEAETIQKVYWVDGIHQPRFINIVGTYTNPTASQFDFSPIISGVPNISVEKDFTGNGLWKSGTIQYYISYYNKFGQETPLIASSSLNYISLASRGGKVDESITCDFKITVSSLNSNYDFLRLYSVRRESNDGPITLNIVNDISLSSVNNQSSITITDNGTNQTTLDSNILLYIGGQVFKGGTLEQKNDTLFIGNLTLDDLVFTDSEVSSIKNAFNNKVSFGYKNINNPNGEIVSINYYEPQLKYPSGKIKGFKFRETYRVGVQFINNRGQWSQPIFIKDIVNSNHPSINTNNSALLDIPTLQISWDSSVASIVTSKNLVGYRAVIAEPTYSNRNIIAQGIISPTMFKYQDRTNNSPYSVASWTMRPRVCGSSIRSNYNFTHYKLEDKEIQVLDGIDSSISSGVSSDVYLQISYTYDSQIPLYSFTCKVFIEDFTVQDDITSSKKSIYTYNEDGNLNNTFDSLKALFKNTNTRNNIFGDGLKITSGGVISPSASTKSLGELALNKYNGVPLESYSSQITTPNNDPLKTSAGATLMELNNRIKDACGAENFFSQPVSDSISEVIIFKRFTGGADTQYNTLDEFKVYVDTNVITIHTPEIENITEYINNNESLKLRIVGIAKVDSNYSNILLETSTPGNASSAGFIRENSTKLTKGNNISFLTSELLYKDYAWTFKQDGKTVDYKSYVPKTVSSGTTGALNAIVSYRVYMWNKSNSITGQTSDCVECNVENAACLKHKVFGNFKYSYNTNYLENSASTGDIVPPKVFNSNEITPLALQPTLRDGSTKATLYYYGNYDTLITPVSKSQSNSITYSYYLKNTQASLTNNSGCGITQYDSVRIKYKSTPHIVTMLQTTGSRTSDFMYLPRLFNDNTNDPADGAVTPIWPATEGRTVSYASQACLGLSTTDFSTTGAYFYIGELYRENNTPYGDTNAYTLQNTNWLPVSDIVSTGSNIIETEGDTYYQRWECLKTYPFTEDDENSVVDITSVMLETHMNIDGRCDVNRGVTNILNARPTNFSLFNPVYNQKNNIFSYKILDSKFNLSTFTNQLTWSLTKGISEDIDTWTSQSLSSVLQLDGNYGDISKIINYNDNLIVFQEKAIAVLKYNENYTVSTEAGVPVEIGNTGKVPTYKYISTSIGCKDKFTVCKGGNGVYFIDKLTKAVYKFSQEGIENISLSKGLSVWFKTQLEINASWKVYYDNITHDIYFSSTSGKCVVYNEDLDCFTSFMDEFYGNIPLLFNLDNQSYYLNYITSSGTTSIKFYRLFAGSYNTTYNSSGVATKVNYSIKYRVNPEPLIDKIFSTLELQADNLDSSYAIDSESSVLTSISSVYPFNKLKVWNEYQTTGTTDIILTKLDTPSNLKTKFRTWRVEIPRQEVDSTNNPYGLNRIRNPWCYIKLGKDFTDSSDTSKMIFHSIIVKYLK